MFSSLHRNVKIRLIESFFNSLLGCMIFPFMIIYFAKNFGEVEAGILSSINVIIGCVAGIYGGHISDRFGRRKLLMVSSLVEAASFLGMGLANYWVEMPVVTFLFCSLNAFLFGLTAPAASAMIIDATTDENRKFVYGLHYWIFNLSFLIGTLIGGLAFTHYKCELMFLLTFGSLVSFAILKFFIEELYTPQEKQKTMFRNYLTIIKDRRFMFYVIGGALVGSLEMQVRNYLTVKLAERDELFNISLLISVNTALVVLFGLVSTYFISKMNHKRAIFYGAALFITFTSLLAGFREMAILVPIMALATIGELILVPAEQAIMANLIPAENRSSYLSVGSLCGRMSMILGSMSVTIGHFLPPMGMVAFLMVCGVVGLLMIMWSMKDHEQQRV